MISAGGPGYKWRGKNFRVIQRKNIECVTLPRRDSCVLIGAKVKPNSIYRVSVMTKSAGGNGMLAVRFCDADCESQLEYVSSKDFKNIIIDVYVKKVKNKHTMLEVYRPQKSSGNLLISNVSVVRIGALEIDKKEPQKPKKIIDSKKVKEISSRQKKLEVLERAAKLNSIMGTRTQMSSAVNRWQGKNIKTVKKYGSVCANISRPDAILLLPVIAIPSSVYKVIVSAAKTSMSSGGSLFINFSGGKGFDGPVKVINVSGAVIRNYSINIETPNTKQSTQIYLRIWGIKGRPIDVTIKDIRYSFVSNISRPTPKNKRKRKKFKSKKVFDISTKEDKIMKFRPYEATKSHIADRINAVLISDASQVPKVSIITPTRDGLTNIKKCWNALEKNTAYPNWEWIVGDSNSSDGIDEYMASINATNIKFVQRGTAEGSFSSINNELVEYAEGEYLLFLNDDTRPQSFWLYEMMSKIYNHPEIGIVGAKLLYAPEKIQHAGIAFMNEGPGNLGKAVLKSFPKDFANYDRFYQAVTGACLLMRREDFDSVGGFDLKYWFCYDDMDLCLKVKHNLKKKIVYAANAEVIHSESVTQKKFKTAGQKQKEGIEYFKKTWMPKCKKDFYSFMKSNKINRYDVDISFVCCVNNLKQYSNFVVGSLFKNNTKRNYETIPILNFGNKYSAARALNIGLKKARSDIVVFLHQDVMLFDGWIDMLFERISEIEKKDKRWGVIGTAGISVKDDTIGLVYNMKGSVQWQSTRKVRIWPIQTVDEHCMIIKKSHGLRFDESFDGFHFYGPSICMEALNRGMNNYGILCPLVHDSKSTSLISGKKEFMKYLHMLNNKWGSKTPIIRTPTSIIRKGTARTFVKFK